MFYIESNFSTRHYYKRHKRLRTTTIYLNHRDSLTIYFFEINSTETFISRKTRTPRHTQFFPESEPFNSHFYTNPSYNFRYMAIMKPLRPRAGKRATLAATAAVWIISALIGSPMLIFFTTSEFISSSGDKRYNNCFNATLNESLWFEILKRVGLGQGKSPYSMYDAVKRSLSS